MDGKQDPPAAQKNITAKTIDVSVEVGQVYYWRIKLQMLKTRHTP